MDGTVIAAMVIIAIFALVAVAAFAVYRRRADVSIRGPWGTGLDVKGSNEEPSSGPGVNVEDAVSRGGGIRAEDKTGRGASVRRVDVQDDILASSEEPDEEQ